MATITSVDAFLDVVRKAGVVDERRLAECLEGLACGCGLPPTPVEMCRHLVQAGLVTRFQAGQLLQGKHRGFIISGKYRLLDRIGAGGMGHVYLCEHIVMRRRVALKVLPAAQADDPGSLERFQREARAAASLDHPNIVRAYDIDCDGRMHFLVMEYVEGLSLQEVVVKNGPLPIATAAHYAWQAAHGLQEAHERGLVHRDIKPANLLVDRKGVVKVLDMGIAKFFREDDNFTKRLDSNTLLGTADYLAPEQALDCTKVDIRADVYGLGATLYYLLVADSPYGAGSVVQKLARAQLKPPPPLRDRRADVPEELAAVVMKMMAREPAQRYLTPAEVAAALAPWAADAPSAESAADLGSSTRPPTTADSTFRLKADDTFTELAPAAAAPAADTAPKPRAAWGRGRWIAAAVVLGVPVGVTAAAYLMPRAEDRPVAFVAAPVASAAPAAVPPPAPPAEPKPAPPPAVVGKALAEARRLAGHADAVERLAVSPDGRQLLSGGYDRVARLWDVATGRPVRAFAGHADCVHAAAFTPDGRAVVTGSHDHTARLWDITTGRAVRAFAGHAGRVWQVALSPDGRQLLTASTDGTARLWDVATGAEVRRLTHPEAVYSVAFAPDGRHALTAGEDGVARVWDLADGRESGRLAGHAGAVYSVAVSADGARVLTAGADGTARVWDAGAGKETARPAVGGGAAWGAAFAAGGRLVVAAGEDGLVRAFDAATGTAVAALAGHTAGVSGLAVTPAGELFTGGHDRTIRAWDLASYGK